jgi:hypothetical protein
MNLNLKEIVSARSTNGRWGLAVVGPEGTTFPAQGSLRHVGTVAGMKTYEFMPGETGTWVMAAGDVTVHGGATLVAREDLQSSQVASLLLLGPEAVVEHHGYKRRGSRVVAYVSGVETDIPGTVLAAMGLLQVDDVVVPVEPPPPLTGAMAAAFAALKKNQE